jgi:hypothetical protein
MTDPEFVYREEEEEEEKEIYLRGCAGQIIFRKKRKSSTTPLTSNIFLSSVCIDQLRSK